MLDLLTINDPYKNLTANPIGDILGRGALQGRTVGGKFTSPSILNNWQAEDFPPDSLFWKRQANASLDYLRKLLADNYTPWADLTWPDETINALTWRTIRDMAEAAINAYECKRERDIINLAEASHAWLKEQVK